MNKRIGPLGRVSLWLGDKLADWIFEDEHDESRPDPDDPDNKEKKSSIFEDLARMF